MKVNVRHPHEELPRILLTLFPDKGDELKGYYLTIENVHFTCYGYWNATTPFGISLQVHDRRYKSVYRRVLVKDRKIDLDKLKAKYEELKLFGEQEAEIRNKVFVEDKARSNKAREVQMFYPGAKALVQYERGSFTITIPDVGEDALGEYMGAIAGVRGKHD